MWVSRGFLCIFRGRTVHVVEAVFMGSLGSPIVLCAEFVFPDVCGTEDFEFCPGITLLLLPAVTVSVVVWGRGSFSLGLSITSSGVI